MAKRKSNKSTEGDSKLGRAVGVGCMTAFALPFAAAGTFVLYLAVAQGWQSYQARNWVEHPATLLQAKLERQQDDGSTTYRATARYEYRYQDLRFESERVAFSGIADNIGSFHQDKGRELEQLLAAGGATVCYLDPDDPSDAVLYRDFRIGMFAFQAIFGLVFCLVGYGLMWAAWYGGRLLKKQAAAKAERPGEPWTWREDWAAGRVRSGLRGKAIGATVFAVLWNLISWPTMIGVLLKEDREWWLPLVIAAFPLVGTVMAVYALRLWFGALRWGRSEFEMAAIPGVLGGRVAGVVHVPRRLQPADGFRVQLQCIRKVEQGSGDDRRTVEDVLWGDERVIGRALGHGNGRETAIPVQFHAPYDKPASNDDDIVWRLSVHAKTAGPDYDAEFELPVFKTPDSSPNAPQDASDDALAAYEMPLSAKMVAERIGARLEYEGPDETVIYFPMAHNRGSTAFLVAFAVGWTGICVGLFYSDAPRLFPWVFSVFGALIDYWALSMLFSSNRVAFGPRGVRVHRRWLVFGQPQEIPADEIECINVDYSGMTSGNTRYQRVVLRTRGGDKHNLANHLADHAAAHKLAELFCTALGLPDKKAKRKASQGDAKLLEGALPAQFE